MEGVEPVDMGIAARLACDEAMQRYPDVVRFIYQAGRVASSEGHARRA